MAAVPQPQLLQLQTTQFYAFGTVVSLSCVMPRCELALPGSGLMLSEDESLPPSGEPMSSESESMLSDSAPMSAGETHYLGPQADFDDVSAQVQSLCRRYERLFSRFLLDSDISRVNAAAGTGSFVSVAPETAQVVRDALRYCALGEGVFDITAGALTRLWKRGFVPDSQDLQDAAKLVNWREVELHEGLALDEELALDEGLPGSSPAIRLGRSGMALDLGGIAKGWVADRVGDLLRSLGVDSFALSLGGNVLTGGTRPDGNPWRVGVQNPKAVCAGTPVAADAHGVADAHEVADAHDAPRILDVIELNDGAAVTSGTYEHCFSSEGRMYHHVLDLQTGFPAETDLASATVVARNALDAEGFSTTLLALGSKKALAFAALRPEIQQVVLVTRDNGLIRG